MISRRAWLAGAGSLGAVAAGVKALDANGLVPPDATGVFAPERTLSYAAHRLLTPGSLAREFPREAISAKPFVNGAPPKDLPAAEGWELTVDGLVSRPLKLKLADLRAMPRRSNITALACEEGWSYIAEWTGVPLAHVLREAGIRPEAKYVMYSSFEKEWWDSLDLNDAFHPQTLLAHGMNGGELPAGHGGPLRMRVPRQLGYKSVKFITKLTAVESMKSYGKGLGSSGAEFGYAWYNGI
jgi:DMSO/TMAO reductase YedYZ molybdopterin-dependent catalytic subunit